MKKFQGWENKTLKQNNGMKDYISVELSDKTGEIAVLEVGGKEMGREFRRVPNNETGLGGTP